MCGEGGLAGAGGVMLLMRAGTAATSQSTASKREREIKDRGKLV